MANVDLVLFQVLIVYPDVVQQCSDEVLEEIAEGVVDTVGECCRYVGNAEGDHIPFVVAIAGAEHCIPLLSFCYEDLMISPSEV